MAKFSATERLTFTLLFSIIVHLAVLGLSFNVLSPPSGSPPKNLDIILAKQQTDAKPDKASYLAQVNNEGGGETDQKSPEPTPDLPVPIVKKDPASIMPQPVARATTKQLRPTSEVEPQHSQAPPEPQAVPVKKQPKKPEPPHAAPPKPKQSAKLLTQQKARHKVQAIKQQGEKALPEVKQQTPAKPSAHELIMSARNEISYLEKRLDQSSRELSEKPTKRRISAATQEYAAAAYMKFWEMKVERIGNINYPEAAKRKKINGSLMLSVDINPDGSVPANGITISRSSGYKVLDNAAIKIVRLGAPYSAIPKNVLRGNDMLTIIRTWKFETGLGLSSR